MDPREVAKIVQMFQQEIEKCLDAKTSWGKIEAKNELNRAKANLYLRMIEGDSNGIST